MYMYAMMLFITHRYDVILQCWSTLGLERPTFETLYAKFDRLLGETTRLQSPYVQVLGTSYYDRLEPKQTDQEQPLDLENAPSNVDTRQCNLSATPDPQSQSNMGALGISLPESSTRAQTLCIAEQISGEYYSTTNESLSTTTKL